MTIDSGDFPLYKIKKWPEPILREVADYVGFDSVQTHNEIIEMFERMWSTLWLHKGYGLAAPQIGKSVRAIIVHVKGGCKIEIVNPEIVKQFGGRFMSDEGCLSYPGRRVRLMRHKQVKVKGLDRYGHPVSFGGKGLQAACLQHEIDHLNGINLADHDLRSA